MQWNWHEESVVLCAPVHAMWDDARSATYPVETITRPGYVGHRGIGMTWGEDEFEKSDRLCPINSLINSEHKYLAHCHLSHSISWKIIGALSLAYVHTLVPTITLNAKKKTPLRSMLDTFNGKSLHIFFTGLQTRILFHVIPKMDRGLLLP